MSDVENYFYDINQSARTSLVGSLDDDPEEAARAITIGKTTGIAPEAIVSNLEEAERQNKAAMGSAIIDENRHIADYLASNPMAPKVSHDDLGQMDEASIRISNMLPDGAVKRWLRSDSISKSFMEGFGEAPIGLSDFIQDEQGYKLAKDYPLYAAVHGAVKTPIELMGRTFGGLLHVTRDALAVPFGDKFANETTAMLEYMMMRGDIGVKSAGGGATGPLGIIEQNAKVFTGIRDAVRSADPYIKNDLNPPPDIHPVIDDIKKQEARDDIKTLDEALRSSVQSATRERAPDLYAQFVKSHVGDREIAIDAEAIRKLYGDKPPVPDDGILGFVPGLGERLQAAEVIGGDVQVPLAEYLAKVDPEVAKELHDHIRVRQGGLTLEELKTHEPKETVADPLTSIRGSAGLEPLFSVGDRKVTLQRLEGKPGQFGPEGGFHDFDLLNEKGENIGTINLSLQKGGKQVYIEDIHAGPQAKGFYDPNYLGPSLIRDLFRQLKEAFPEAESITGHRAGGARWKGKPDTATDIVNPMPVVKFDETPRGWTTIDGNFRELLKGIWQDRQGFQFFRGEKTVEQQALTEAVERAVRKIAPLKLGSVEASPVDLVRGEGRTAGGAYLRFENDLPGIIVSLERGEEAIGIGRHEAIHHLRKYGFFNDTEWATLQKAAKDNGWLEKHGIGKDRYLNLPEAAKLEEAIAEEYRAWSGGRDTAPEAVTIFEKLKELFESIKTAFKELTGKDLDWDEIFKQVESGKIGGREGTQPLAEKGRTPFSPEPAFEEELKTFPKAANDIDAFGKDKFKSYDAAARDQKIKQVVDKNTHVGDYNYWQKIAEKENIGGKITNTPNGFYAARKYSEGGKTTMLITPEGIRTVYKDGVKVVKERYRDVEGFDSSFSEGEGPGLYDKGKALGVTEAHMNRMLNLIRKRNEEDLAKHEKRAKEDLQRRSNKEWKERRTMIRDEVREQLEARPDLATDEFFAKGQIKIHPDFLTEEQKASLPKDYIQKKNGVDPDEIAPYFGYTSGSALVDRLGVLSADRMRSGMSSREYFNRLVDIETDRRLNAEFGNREAKILEDAKDQALSETQLNLVHEETLAYALAAGEEPKFTKEQVTDMVQQVFQKVPVGQISSDKLLQTAGKLGKKIEEAGAKGNWAEAYRISQQRQHAVIAAKIARDYERARASFDRTAKMFRKREVASVDQVYTNWVHDLLIRTGHSVNRSIQDLAENIGKQSQTTLREFADAKYTEWMGMRDLPIEDMFLDPSFRKPLKELTLQEFGDYHNAIDMLYKAGRDEKKIYREGEAADRNAILGEMRDKLATFPLKEYPATKGRMQKILNLPRTFFAGMTNIETLMNRWDRADPRGVFNRYIAYPLARASNAKNVMEREAARNFEKLGRLSDPDKLVDSPFADPLKRTDDNPDGAPFTRFTRRNVMAMVHNAGNKSNWNVLARGYGMEPEALMQWLFRNSDKEMWDRAQKMGDMFKGLAEKADGVYERMTGATIEKIQLAPIETPFGTYEGWYHPLIRDPLRKEIWVQDDAGQWSRKPAGRISNALDDTDNYHISTANGYTKRRTGAIYPLDLNVDAIPSRMKQIIHDVAFRETLHEIQKVFGNHAFEAEVIKRYGEHYQDLLMPFLRNMAGAESMPSKAQSTAAHVSEYLRQNVISTYIGFNPYTALKHGPTAWVMSMREVGGKDFLEAVASLYGRSPEVGLRNSEFAMKWSEELQRRERHWQDTIIGEHRALEGSANLRERIIEKGSWLVAQSDMLSAKPTWVAAYNKYLRDGLSHGESIDLADRAVRRAHGSTSQTNQPALVRGGGPLHGWLTSVYGFFGTAMQRRIEIAHQLSDAYRLGKEGEINAAAKKVPGILADIMTYVIWPTIVEEWVTGLTTDDRRGWGTHLAAGMFMGLSSSVLYLRDIAHAAVTGHDPGVGLLSSALHDANQLLRDFKKGKEAFNKQNAGRTVGDTLNVFGEATGMAPKTINNSIRFGIDLVNKQTHPRSLDEVRMGVTRGTTKRREQR